MDFGIFDHMDYDGAKSLYEFYDDRLKLVELYDQIGIRAYHLAEHHATPLGMSPSPNLFLSAVAQRTNNLRFGPLVYCLPMYHPIRLIEEICMLDQMSGGRLEMGIGRGISPIELNYWGVEYENGAEIYKETFELIKKGLEGESLSYEGDHFRVDNMPLHLNCVQKPYPPLWYGVANPNSTAWPADNGFNIITNQSPKIALEITRNYKDRWQGNGKSMENLPKLGMTRYIVIDKTTDKALKVARRAYHIWRKNFMALWLLHGKEPIGVRYPETFDGLTETGQGIAGSPNEVLDQLSTQSQSTGINYLVARFVFGDLSISEAIRSIELFAAEVKPKLANLVTQTE